MKQATLPIKLITVEDRSRQDLGDLYELSQSIKENGLICPIAVWEQPDGKFKLLAGQRRLTACLALKWETIACRIYERQLTEAEMFSIELAENFYRKNMRPDEEALLRKKIHDILVEEKGEKIARDKNAPGHSMADTADLLGKSRAAISQDIKIAKIIEAMPEVDWSQFKSKNDMKNFIRNFASSVDRKERADKVEKELGVGDRLIKRLVDAFIIGDFFDKIKEVPDSYFTFIEVDPPYAIGLQTVKKHYSYEGYNEIEPVDYPSFMRRTLKECYRVAKSDAFMVVWFAAEPWFEQMYQWITDAGWVTTREVGVWFKSKDVDSQAYGQEFNPLTQLAGGVELFFWCRKGKPSLGKPGRSNGFSYRPMSKNEGKYHPTQRPLEMMIDMVETFSKEGDRVLVPFAGSGTTLLAAALSKRVPLGFDLTEAYKNGYVLEVDKHFNVIGLVRP